VKREREREKEKEKEKENVRPFLYFKFSSFVRRKEKKTTNIGELVLLLIGQTKTEKKRDMSMNVYRRPEKQHFHSCSIC